MLFNVYSSKLVKSKPGVHDMGVMALALDPTSFFDQKEGGVVGGEFSQFKMASAGNDSSVKLWTVKCKGQPANSSESLSVFTQ